MADHTPILATNDSGTRTEIYLLQPGEHFAPFGGSKSGLTVRKTASLIVRRVTEVGTFDTEYDANDPAIWASIRRAVRKQGLADDDGE